MRKKITVRILLAGILAALLAGTAQAKPYTITDDLGREITVDAPTKVIPTIGSYTKIWMLAGGTDSIVAASNDSWEEFHLELPESTVNLGKTKELNLELLAAQEPDLILASANTQAGLERLETYENMGLTAAYFTVNNVNDYLRMLKICTDITGNEAAYEQYGTEVSGQVQRFCTSGYPGKGSRPNPPRAISSGRCSLTLARIISLTGRSLSWRISIWKSY